MNGLPPSEIEVVNRVEIWQQNSLKDRSLRGGSIGG